MISNNVTNFDRKSNVEQYKSKQLHPNMGEKSQFIKNAFVG